MKTVLPAGRWVLHSAPLLGGLTDRWIDLQARSGKRYETRLLGGRIAEGAERRAHWIASADRRDTALAHRWLYRSRGLSGGVLGRPLHADPPAVVHAHYGDFAAQHRRLARSLGAPLVASFYGYDATKDVYRAEARWRRAYRRLFDEAAAVVTEGPAMAERVAGLGCPAEKVRVVRMPADAGSLAELETAKEDYFLAVAAGRFIEKKGFDVAIRAFARALGGRADARLLMLGGGELEPSLRGLAEELGIADQVAWMDRLPFEDFMTEVARAHVGLYPSRTAASGDSEGGAPVTLIEAQWLGVPSIVSDHDDLAFVSAPDGSYVLPALDVEAWAETLDELYRDPAALHRMSREARAFARANHDPAANLAAREDVYDEASR
jgi:colanic acid/amylovoran biosynthesis glycosyltransferase